MSYIVHEKSKDKINKSKDDIWAELIAAGLANANGELNESEFMKLGVLGDDDAENVLGAIFGIDTRTEVVETKQFPYNSIVSLDLRYGDESYIGTGFLVSEEIVLTAGHNLFDKATRTWADEIYVFTEPKNKENMTTFKELKVPRDYTAATGISKIRYDWGLIKLKEKLQTSSVVKIAKAQDVSDILSKNIKIAGYPLIVKGAESDKMWEADGGIDQYEVVDEMLYYKISTSGGNSGSPVLVESDEGWTAIGVHGGSYSQGGIPVSNRAKAIDDVLLRGIREF